MAKMALLYTDTEILSKIYTKENVNQICNYGLRWDLVVYSVYKTWIIFAAVEILKC